MRGIGKFDLCGFRIQLADVDRLEVRCISEASQIECKTCDAVNVRVWLLLIQEVLWRRCFLVRREMRFTRVVRPNSVEDILPICSGRRVVKIEESSDGFIYPQSALRVELEQATDDIAYSIVDFQLGVVWFSSHGDSPRVGRSHSIMELACVQAGGFASRQQVELSGFLAQGRQGRLAVVPDTSLPLEPEARTTHPARRVPRHATWRACARPISPPPGHAVALFDMFCGLNGTTRTPHRRATRQSPATTTDFPTSDPVPWTMSTCAINPLPPGNLSGTPSSVPDSGLLHQLATHVLSVDCLLCHMEQTPPATLTLPGGRAFEKPVLPGSP